MKIGRVTTFDLGWITRDPEVAPKPGHSGLATTQNASLPNR